MCSDFSCNKCSKSDFGGGFIRCVACREVLVLMPWLIPLAVGGSAAKECSTLCFPASGWVMPLKSLTLSGVFGWGGEIRRGIAVHWCTYEGGCIHSYQNVWIIVKIIGLVCTKWSWGIAVLNKTAVCSSTAECVLVQCSVLVPCIQTYTPVPISTIITGTPDRCSSNSGTLIYTPSCKVGNAWV